MNKYVQDLSDLKKGDNVILFELCEGKFDYLTTRITKISETSEISVYALPFVQFENGKASYNTGEFNIYYRIVPDNPLWREVTKVTLLKNVHTLIPNAQLLLGLFEFS